MATQLEIANSALIKLGAEEVSSLSDNVKRAKLINEQYDKIKKRFLRSHPWKFAIKREKLTDNGNTPVYGYAHEYDLPTGFLRLLQIENGESVDFTFENGKILSDSDEINARYIYDAPESNFDDNAAECLAFEIAIDICYALVQSLNFKQQLRQEYEQFKREARSYNGQQGKPQDLGADEWLTVRL